MINTMKLFVGLGNPGKAYENSRHNVGAGFIDYIAQTANLNFENKFKGKFTDLTINDEKVLLLKPETYMNKSGDAVSELVNFYKISPEEIYIVFDDLDILQGDYKIQVGKYPKIHNGVNDVIRKIGTDKINFIRIGVDARSQLERDFIKGSDYVLQKTDFDFSPIYSEIKCKLLSN